MIPHFHIMPGIGDSGWLFQKLQGQFKQIDVTICDSGPRRSEEYLKMLGVREVHYARQPKPRGLYKTSLSYDTDLEKLDYSTPQRLEVNGWMERGNRIEDWLPQYPTKYQLDFKTLPTHHQQASVYLAKYDDGSKTIVVYTSSARNNRKKGFLNPQDWINLILSMRNLWGKDTHFIIVGAHYDKSCTDHISKWLKNNKVRCSDVVGCHIGQTIEILRGADGVVSYPSGIGITASFVGTPCLMWMFPSIRKMHYKWISPEVQERGEFIQHCMSEKADVVKHLSKLNIR